LLQSEIGVLIADSFYAELAASVKDVAAYALCGFIYYREICRGMLEFGLQRFLAYGISTLLVTHDVVGPIKARNSLTLPASNSNLKRLVVRRRSV
jgi:hypothetical protein